MTQAIDYRKEINMKYMYDIIFADNGIIQQPHRMRLEQCLIEDNRKITAARNALWNDLGYSEDRFRDIIIVNVLYRGRCK